MWFVFVFITMCGFSTALSAHIRPHRALYNIELKHVNQDSDIENVKGKMSFELKQENKGWSISQESVTSLFLKTGDSETLIAHYNAWESEDGRDFKFVSSKTCDWVEIDYVEGYAHFSPTEFSVTFKQPTSEKFVLERYAIPPVSHIKSLVAAAKEGKRMLHERVFDGSFYGTEVGINTFISKKKPVCAAVKSKDVKNQWPIKMAVFEENDEENGLPTFEMTQNLSDNGVMCSYTLDFGDYSVIGTLEKIEYIDKK